jgi:hypothetical protein
MSLNFKDQHIDIPPGIPEPTNPNGSNPNGNNDDSNDNKRYCNLCLRKDPPVTTELIVGINIKEKRWNRGWYVCDECSNQYQRDLRNNKDEQFAEYKQQKHDEALDELSIQWEDPAYKKLPFADRLYKVWNKYNRRSPETGIRKKWILEVVLADLWSIDANAIADDWMNQANWNRNKKNTAKPYVVQLLANQLDFLQIPYQRKAENIFDGAVDAIIGKYGSRDKIVAQPAYIDPVTKECVDNWFLLSREQEREWREQAREMKKERMDTITEEERKIIEGLKIREKQEGGETN